LSPKSDAWKEADLDAALRRRLGESYDELKMLKNSGYGLALVAAVSSMFCF
jgi:hypothetical protein